MDGPRRYTFSPELRGQAQLLMWLCPLMFAGLLAVVLVSPPKNRGDRIALGSLLLGSAAGVVFAVWARPAFHSFIEVAEDGITYVRGNRSVTVRWHEIQRVEYRRFAKRLKVFSTTGAVINIEKQLAGFAEIAETLFLRTGQPSTGIARARVAAITEPAISIGAPRWTKPLLLVLIAGAAYMFSIRFLILAWRDRDMILFAVALVGAWFVWKAGRNGWYQVALRVDLDEAGIRCRLRDGEISASWSDIGTARLEHVDGVSWFVVRDRQGESILALRREMFNWSGSAMKQFDRLVEVASQQALQRGSRSV